MKLFLLLLLIVLFGCKQQGSNKSNQVDHASSYDQVKEELLSLERKWIEAEFALDTAYISTLMHYSFLDISADHLHDKQQALKGMYDNMEAMRQDDIFLDSLKFEDVRLNLFEGTAVLSLITHTYKKEKGKAVEKRMRFYDVWIKDNGKWKALSSQGTVISDN